MEPFDKYRLRHPSNVHLFTELLNMNPWQLDIVVQAAPQSTDLLIVSGELRIGGESWI